MQRLSVQIPAVHLPVRPGKIRGPRRIPRAAEKAVALDEHRRAPCPSRRAGRRDAGGPAAEHHHFVLRQHRRVALRLAGGPTALVLKCAARIGETVTSAWPPLPPSGGTPASSS